MQTQPEDFEFSFLPYTATDSGLLVPQQPEERPVCKTREEFLAAYANAKDGEVIRVSHREIAIEPIGSMFFADLVSVDDTTFMRSSDQPQPKGVGVTEFLALERQHQEDIFKALRRWLLESGNLHGIQLPRHDDDATERLRNAISAAGLGWEEWT